MWFFIILEILFIIYTIYHYKKKIAPNSLKISTKSKWFIGIAIFCSIGSLVLIPVLEVSAPYSILATVFYLLFILSTNKEVIQNSSQLHDKDLEIATQKKILANREKEIEELKNQIEELKNISKDSNTLKDLEAKFLSEIESLKHEKNILQKELDDLNKNITIEYGNIADYSNISSQEIKNQLNMLKLEQDNLVKNNMAVLVTIAQTSQNKKVISNNIRQLFRCFNNECNSIINNLTIKNIDSSRNKLYKSFTALNKLYELDFVQLSTEFYESKLKELTLNYSYIQQLENEREQQKAIREQLIEEEKVRKEIEKAKIKIEKEENQFKNEISKLMSYLNKTTIDIEKQLYVDKIKELETKLSSLQKDKENILQREQNTRAGFVYIISNVGSFGENIYKIGMTRRLEPMDRIKELSDASVPFSFDVHALIFSDDAPTLENILHKTFEKNRVNQINPRKEFYNIDLEKIKEVVKNNYNNTVNFINYADAYEYRESQKRINLVN